MASTTTARSLFHAAPTHLPASKRPSPASTSVGIPSVRLAPGVSEFKDRRRRRRIALQPMYTSASVRVLARQDGAIEGHVINLSETGMVVEIDDLVGAGQAVTVEFSVAGLGRTRAGDWPTYAVAGEVVRIDDLDDFPKGPYRTAIRFVRIPTMAQAQIARFIVTHPDKAVV